MLHKSFPGQQSIHRRGAAGQSEKCTVLFLLLLLFYRWHTYKSRHYLNSQWTVVRDRLVCIFKDICNFFGEEIQIGALKALKYQNFFLSLSVSYLMPAPYSLH